MYLSQSVHDCLGLALSIGHTKQKYISMHIGQGIQRVSLLSYLIIYAATLIWNKLQWFVNHLNCCYAVSTLPFGITENWYTQHYFIDECRKIQQHYFKDLLREH